MGRPGVTEILAKAEGSQSAPRLEQMAIVIEEYFGKTMAPLAVRAEVDAAATESAKSNLTALLKVVEERRDG